MQDNSISCHRGEVNYQKYLKKVDINTKLTKQLLTSSHHVEYVEKPQASTYQHPRYPSFNLGYPRINTQRQLQYYRSVDPHMQVPTQLLTTLIEEDRQHLICRKRNRGLMIEEDTLQYIYCKDKKVRSMALQASSSCLKIVNEVVLCDPNQPVLQLANHKQYILVRCHYNCYLHSILGNLIHTLQFDDEIICSLFDPYNRNTFISAHEKSIKINHLQTNFQEPINLKSTPTSLDFHSKDTLIMQQQNGIYSLDLRSNLVNLLTKSNDLLYDVKWARSQFRNSPYYVVSSSINLETYDCRNTVQPCLRVKHMSQEVPPNIIQILQGNARPNSIAAKMSKKIRKWDNMIITAFNASHQANCLFWQHVEPKIDRLTILDSMRKQDSKQSKYSQKYPVLLYDSGKAFDNCYPIALTPFFADDGVLGFLQVDNLGGISFQAYQLAQHYEPVEVRNQAFQTDFKSRDMVNYERVKRLQKVKYYQPMAAEFKMELDQDEAQLRQGSRGPIELRKTAVADLRQFQNRLFQLAQSMEEIDREQSEESQGEQDGQIPDGAEKENDEIGRKSTLVFLKESASEIGW